MESKEYLNWHNNKTILQNDKARPHFREAEIWSCSMGLNVGFEQDGRGPQFLRPIVVVKKFNNEILWGVPLTKNNKKGPYYFSFNMDNLISTAILSQIRLIDGKRLQYKMGILSKGDFIEIKKNLTQLLV